MPKGSKVTPADKTADMLGGIVLKIDNFYNNRTQDVEQLAEELAFYMKRKNIGMGGAY